MKCKIVACICALVWMLSLSQALSADIPGEVKDRILICPGGKVVGVESATLGDGRQSYDVDIQAEGANYSNIVSFYRQEAGKRKWRIFNDVDRGYSYILQCHDGRYNIDITVTTKENSVLVRLSILG
ncbi:hypothetical protein [Desulfonema magnum]|uniref:Uncharacterized protein n=1 Tax=Desulfonema magnum TaxID=45655 RepID=A0A975GRG0_9BACT|nr:hypothetical protein [Desulfonema magnum]QTA90959.1 Uncharacterized protein dnm_070230 [Desulfonema magnum]